MTALAINKHYNFSVYANSILGTTYINAKLKSILDFRTAIKFANVELLHRQVFPYLPPNTISDPNKYSFYLFEVNGKDVVIADVWILQNSIEETQGVNYSLRLNNITPGQMSMVRDQLRLLGISFDIL